MYHKLIPLLFILIACGETTVESEGVEPITAQSESVNLNSDTTLTITENGQDEKSETTDLNQNNEYESINWDDYIESMSQDYSFVILISTKSYDSALKRAKEASEKLGYPLDLRDLHANEETGLSLPKEQCEEICGGIGIEYPQYLPRRDWGPSKYVSVEYSDGYSGFTKGYYIVIVASGEKDDPVIQEALSESQKYYPDAYAKTCSLYMGCGC